ncbi:MAG: twin-arginine translocase subunit TatB [Clostridia bacterium]|nr:twin-arginine translocase subunit TatB [Clostridia bacterium]
MFNMGSGELILILLVAFIIVGPKDLPKVARAIGRAIRYIKAMFEEFKEETGLGEALEELKETERDLKKTIKEADPTEEIRQAGHEVESAVRDVEKSVKAEFKPEEKN